MASGNGKATELRQLFRRAVRVSVSIRATPDRVWALLTNAADMPRWNSTVTSVEGTVAPGARLAIKVPISTRTFKVKVDTFEPARTLVWSDGNAVFRGVRTYVLSQQAGGSTLFDMEEVFTGVMLPLIARSLPDFKPVFEQYAADLKREAERR